MSSYTYVAVAGIYLIGRAHMSIIGTPEDTCYGEHLHIIVDKDKEPHRYTKTVKHIMTIDQAKEIIEYLQGQVDRHREPFAPIASLALCTGTAYPSRWSDELQIDVASPVLGFPEGMQVGWAWMQK